MALLFCIVNGYLQGRTLTRYIVYEDRVRLGACTARPHAAADPRC